ncbi:NAD-dependent epimerase/dehydratase family protein [Uliginosibacterium sp. H1]|uniref:NAD-dependent epimerase/dehydratase family protein n=1 Tax=Uliginosibacterium sp. H1 TaxID=3114757 RepID=UPI002E1853D3|nr:NAD-dependent epimerase/dehydratase family protein [Uliginosibacterium sp. H1]
MDRKIRVLVTGCDGQIGRVLVPALRERHGEPAVVASDLREPDIDGPTAKLDVTDADAVRALIAREKPDHVYHLAGVLSAVGERDPGRAWQVNLNGFLNVLEACREHGVSRVFFPSTIAVYGPDAASNATPDDAPTRPTTVYGIAKAAGENLAAWYRRRFNLDVRVLRYPGVIGWESLPGGGTTDYAVEIYHAAVAGETYRCPLSAERALPMLAMADAIRGTIDFMAAPAEQIRQSTGYNLGGFSGAPQDFVAAITRLMPAFKVQYQPDHRDQIAASWPAGLDDSAARQDWGWAPQFDIDSLSEEMLAQCAAQLAARAAAQAAEIASQRYDNLERLQRKAS